MTIGLQTIVLLLGFVASLLIFWQRRQLLIKDRALSEMADENRTLTQQRDQAERRATYDQLTGILNRSGGLVAAEHELSVAKRSGRPGVVMLLDLDGFKDINDSLGHGAGDLVLVEVAQRMRVALRTSDVLARWGGDEFFVLLSGTSLRSAWQVAERIIVEINRAYSCASDRLVGVSVGLAIYQPDDDLQDIIQQADKAMYASKAAGKNQVTAYGR